ncbi:hypothetical protein [Leptospira interrogans]|uniref:hypothetical protein n=1 Tax=Leptospira interrogans TaxID=173 RepID=UPI0002B9C310|nr:hypothetical protein [Leptospira interrogans]MCR8646386.1 hypothetical protein [Leptospira interrogans serovar Bataviae]OAM78176.1 hypothetical protein A1343_04580 [Leptospira interrogans serovar Bataviae]QOI39399.1 hypothetical protein Lepto1548_14750 [Leptospira interrogans serovar Bataviae]QYY59665.1 hypothetical protein GR153_013685 [Leptospira interrogans serovar Bataviae]
MSISKEIEDYFKEIKTFKSALKKEENDRINKIALRIRAEGISKEWFSHRKPSLVGSIERDILEKYDEMFERLLKISAPSNLKKSYNDVLVEIASNFKEDIIVTLVKNPTGDVKQVFETLMAGIVDSEEKDYLHEAIKCADRGYFRAAAVMGWCAAISRIHNCILKHGFTVFNVTSARIASDGQGRFKRFKKTFNVQSLSDLRQVFDTDILWVLEGMGLIDLNEHTRLRSCFDLRNQSAHPGDAPVTEYNLLSFFSDIKEIILLNTKFDN